MIVSPQNEIIMDGEEFTSWINEDCPTKDIQNITTLYLDDFYYEIPYVLYKFKNLKHLYCNGCELNKISNIPESVSFLDISNNNIQKIENLPSNLKHLSCRDNKLEYIYNDDLPQTLETIDFSNNVCLKHIYFLPKQLETLLISNTPQLLFPLLPSNLEYLYCNNNPHITLLPPLPNTLTSLYVNNCSLQYLIHLPNSLKKIQASNNKLFYIDSFPTNLISIDISYNTIKNIPSIPPSVLYFYNDENELSI